MDLNVVSKHRSFIYGFAILWIVLFHASNINHVDYTFGHKSLELFKLVMDSGNVGVDVFLFLSGISLYFSFSKNRNIGQFLVRRFWRVVPAVWLIFGWFWALRYLIETFALAEFVPRMLLIDYFFMTGDGSMWYVNLIVLLYLAYPLIFEALYGSKDSASLRNCLVMIAVVVAITLSFWQRNPEAYGFIDAGITRIPVFLIGCYWGKLVFEKRIVSKAFIPLVFLAVVVFFAVLNADVLHGPARRYFYAVGGISIAYALALTCSFFAWLFEGRKKRPRPIYRFASWVGGFSLELYVSHIMLNQLMFHFFDWYIKGNLGVYLFMATCALFLAFGASKVIPKIQKACETRWGRKELPSEAKPVVP